VRGRATEIIDMADVLPRAQDGLAPADRAGSTVLLVEDNAFFRDMLTPVLQAAGYRVRTAASADQALQAVLRHRVDVLVTDLELPDRPGLDLVEALRRHAATRSMPVVALATRMDDRDAARADELGIAATVSKFDRSGLIAALSRATEGSCLELAA
jgi:two-component system chemotaxis sensor kinase CheA